MDKTDKDFIDEEIRQELNQPDDSEQIYAMANKVARKPFVIHDFDPMRDREMAVFTAAKKLAEYIFVVTEKSPKKLRWSIVTRLQNSSVELIEYLYRANTEQGEKRADFQKQAQTALSLIDFYSETARCMQAITIRQTGIIARQLYEIKKMLNGWMRSKK